MKTETEVTEFLTECEAKKILTVADLCDNLLHMAPVFRDRNGDIVQFGDNIPLDSVCGRDCCQTFLAFRDLEQQIATVCDERDGPMFTAYRAHTVPIIHSVLAVLCNG